MPGRSNSVLSKPGSCHESVESDKVKHIPGDQKMPKQSNHSALPSRTALDTSSVPRVRNDMHKSGCYGRLLGKSVEVPIMLLQLIIL